ncbi:MAG: RidA family protein [Candidatus Saccharimonadia bacterium]
MSKDFIEDIVPADYASRGSYTPAKKIDLGGFYLIYVSGIQPPKDDNHRVITDDIEEQTKLVFETVSKILGEAGASMDDVVKAVIYITDMKDFDKISKIRAGYFANSKPVSTMVETTGTTRIGSKIELEVTAIIKKLA